MIEKYKIIDNFLTQEELKLCVNYFQNSIRFYPSFYFTSSNAFLKTYHCHSKYADPLTESLLVNKLELVENITGKKLYPTYSYYRLYTHNDILASHKDRKACEYSVTLCIEQKGGEWNILMDNVAVKDKPGQAIVYKGCEAEHERKPFEGDYSINLFLHYVDQDGPNKDFKFDLRPMVGAPKVPITTDKKER